MSPLPEAVLLSFALNAVVGSLVAGWSLWLMGDEPSEK
jgi:hypothetical protein